MSESLNEKSFAVEQTEEISESNDEEVVTTQEVSTTSNITRAENLTESKDDNAKENVSLENDIITEIEQVPLVNKVTDISSSPPKPTETQDHIETEQVQNAEDISGVTAKAICNSTQQTSSIETNLLENHDRETSSEIPEGLESKDSAESNIKEDEITSPAQPTSKINTVTDNPCVGTKVVIDSPPKTSSIQQTIHENHDKEIPESRIKKDAATPEKSLSMLENDDASETLPNKDCSETTKSPAKSSTKDEHAEHVTYTDDGSAIYTDPQTKYQYKWCTTDSKWIPCDSDSSTTNPYENEHYKWCSETEKWIPKVTQVTETEHYKWDAEKNEWIAKVKDVTASELTKPTEVKHDIDKDGQRTYTDKDGTVFFWDVEKNAWFPKIDDDFMARYQMSYGFIDNTSDSLREKEELELKNKILKEQELERLVEEAKANDEASSDKKGIKRKAQQEPPKWFDIDPAQNTKVYVTNLPLDITLDEFADVMGKCGMIMRDPQTQKYKLKLYTEADGQVKGDGLCDYIKVESVDLALKILDEYELRGQKIRVQRAKFQMRGEYNPALKPKRKKKDKEKLAKIKEKLFDWRPEKMRGERSKNEKTVIIKNLFQPELFEKEVQLILDYQTDLREECAKCGTVRKVVVYDRHSEGVAQINMSSPEEADLVIQMMQGRFFGKRQLTAEHWDGKTKYKVEETEEDIKKRLNKWDQYLETEEHKKSEVQSNEVLEKPQQITEKNENADLQKPEQITENNKNSALEKPQQSSEESESSDLQNLEQITEKNENSDVQKTEQITERNENSDVQKTEHITETNENSDLQEPEQSIEENENSDLQKDEQDIEKTINFANN